MEVLLSSTRSGSEKKKILEEEFGVAMSEELEREVLEVCNLSQGVRAEGREEGRQEGRMHHIVFSKCTIKCRKCGGADCGESP